MISNTFVVVLSSTGYLAGQLRQHIHIVLGERKALPDLDEILGSIG